MQLANKAVLIDFFYRDGFFCNRWRSSITSYSYIPYYCIMYDNKLFHIILYMIIIYL